ncbi:hypothetical protein HYY70_00370 [Candidatus Woesearchaeota archaeon]|nr:hypothetical protein [Candidatus Woesearchaeota archaeon]
MSETQNQANLQQRIREFEAAFRDIKTNPHLGGMEGERQSARFNYALIRLHEADPQLAAQHVRTYNRWLDSLPNPCECMYIHSLE